MSSRSDSRRAGFRCPVCRAKQPIQPVCRRCQADLRLVVAAHRRVDYLRGEIQGARAEGDRHRAEELTAELECLSPASLSPASLQTERGERSKD